MTLVIRVHGIQFSVDSLHSISNLIHFPHHLLGHVAQLCLYSCHELKLVYIRETN